jgi:AAHS family 4-hydroxybenzoate transporter-like MFS transporter
MSAPSPPRDPDGAATATSTFDISDAIDRSRWTGLQKMVLVLAALAVILDGFDNQLLGFSITLIAQEFGAPRSAFSWILALGYVGVGLGTAIGGIVGDRVGRKSALMISVAVFGVCTLLASVATSVLLLGICRIGAGVGIGMVFPAVAALIAEFTPLRRRSLAVALSIACVPVGGLIGGVVAAAMLESFGWRALWVLGGVFPLVLIGVLFAVLPESPQFLLARGTQKDRTKLVRTMGRIGHRVASDTAFVNRHDREVTRASAAALLRPEHRRDSIGIWTAFFFGLMGVFAFYSWGPTLLVDYGFSQASASLSVTAYNLGAILTAVIGAWAMGRYGSKTTLIVLAAGAGATGLWLFVAQPSVAGPRGLFIAQLFLHGGFMGGLQTVVYPLAAQLYPVSIRATGVGAAGTVGRLGAILASFVGASLVAMGGGTFFLLLAVAGFMAGAALLIIRHHTPPARNEMVWQR